MANINTHHLDLLRNNQNILLATAPLSFIFFWFLHLMALLIIDNYSKAAVSKNPDHTMRHYVTMNSGQKSDYMVNITSILNAIVCSLWFPYSALGCEPPV